MFLVVFFFILNYLGLRIKENSIILECYLCLVYLFFNFFFVYVGSKNLGVF